MARRVMQVVRKGTCAKFELGIRYLHIAACMFNIMLLCCCCFFLITQNEAADFLKIEQNWYTWISKCSICIIL